MTRNEMKAILLSWAQGLLGSVPIIYANQNGPRPSTMFATLNVISTVYGWAGSVVNIPDDEENVGRIGTIRNVTSVVEFQFFGPGAVNACDVFVSASGGQAARSNTGNVAFVRIVSGANDISTVVGSAFEERAQVDMEFRFANQAVETVGRIDSVDISGELSVDDTVTLDVDLTVEEGE